MKNLLNMAYCLLPLCLLVSLVFPETIVISAEIEGMVYYNSRRYFFNADDIAARNGIKRGGIPAVIMVSGVETMSQTEGRVGYVLSTEEVARAKIDAEGNYSVHLDRVGKYYVRAFWSCEPDVTTGEIDQLLLGKTAEERVDLIRTGILVSSGAAVNMENVNSCYQANIRINPYLNCDGFQEIPLDDARIAAIEQENGRLIDLEAWKKSDARPGEKVGSLKITLVLESVDQVGNPLSGSEIIVTDTEGRVLCRDYSDSGISYLAFDNPGELKPGDDIIVKTHLAGYAEGSKKVAIPDNGFVHEKLVLRSQEKYGTVSGRLIYPHSGKPVSDAVIVLRGLNVNKAEGKPFTIGLNRKTSVTDSGGRFSFDDIPPGKYELAYLNTWGYRVPGDSESVILTAGDDKEGNLELIIGGMVEGIITDKNGGEMRGVSVMAVKSGRKDLEWQPTVTTDDKGYYKLGPLPPGDIQMEIEAGGIVGTETVCIVPEKIIIRDIRLSVSSQ